MGIARGTINIRPLRGRRLSAHQAAKPHNTVGPAPNDSRFLRFTKYQRSDSIGAPSPPGRLIGPSNQNVNRVVLRFMTKVFRSFLSKIRTRQVFSSLVLITKRILAKPSRRRKVEIPRSHRAHLLDPDAGALEEIHFSAREPRQICN